MPNEVDNDVVFVVAGAASLRPFALSEGTWLALELVAGALPPEAVGMTLPFAEQAAKSIPAAEHARIFRILTLLLSIASMK
jgi:hypothetical protein